MRILIGIVAGLAVLVPAGLFVAARVVVATDTYVYAEARSRVFGFVDDVEFRFDDSAKKIDFRSASRVGRRDFGVNRSRMETIRELLIGD